MLGLPNPWLILAAVVAIGAAGLAGDLAGAKRGRDSVQVQWDKENAQRALKSAENVQRARDTQERLQKAQDDDRQKHAATVADLDARLRAAMRELSKRPARPRVPDNQLLAAGPGAGSGCTGAGLYADDGLFLAGKADLFQRIRLQRDACYISYGRAQEEVKKLRARVAVDGGQSGGP